MRSIAAEDGFTEGVQVVGRQKGLTASRNNLLG